MKHNLHQQLNLIDFIQKQKFINTLIVKYEDTILELSYFYDDLTSETKNLYYLQKKSNQNITQLLAIYESSINFTKKFNDKFFTSLMICYFDFIGFPVQEFISIFKNKIKFDFGLNNLISPLIFDQRFSLLKQSLIIVSEFDREFVGRVKYINYSIESLTKFNVHEILNNELDLLMPRCYKNVHKTFISSYYNIPGFGNAKENLVIYLMNKNGLFSLNAPLFKFYPYFESNIQIVL